MNLKNYKKYSQEHPEFQTYNKYVDPFIFGDFQDNIHQVRDTDVLYAAVPAMKQSILAHGQAVPCTAAKDSRGNDILKEGITRAVALQELYQDGVTKDKRGEKIKGLLVNDWIAKKLQPDGDFWWKYSRENNDHLVQSSNTEGDIKKSINEAIEIGRWDRLAGCQRHQKPKHWLATAINDLAVIYSNSSVTRKKLGRWVDAQQSNKEACKLARGKLEFWQKDKERFEFIENNMNQLPFDWEGKKVGHVHKNNTIYFATRRNSWRKNIISYAFDKTNTAEPTSVYVLVYLETKEIYGKSTAEIKEARQWYRDEAKRTNAHPLLKKPLIKGVFFFPQIRKAENMNKFIT